MLLFPIEILQDIVNLATVASDAHLPSTLLLQLSDTLLVPVRLRVERLVVLEHMRGGSRWFDPQGLAAVLLDLVVLVTIGERSRGARSSR